MIKVEVIVRASIMCSDMEYAVCIECVVHFVGIVVECLYEKWCRPLAICNRSITTYNWNSFKKFICHQPYFEWYPGILFYKWFGNQTRIRLLTYYNTTMRNTYSAMLWATDENSIGSKPVATKDQTRVLQEENHDRKNDWIVLLRFCDLVIFGGIANLSFIFMLIYVN